MNPLPATPARRTRGTSVSTFASSRPQAAATCQRRRAAVPHGLSMREHPAAAIENISAGLYRDLQRRRPADDRVGIDRNALEQR